MVKKTVMLCALCASLTSAGDIFETERIFGVEAGYAEVQGFHPTNTSDNLTYGLRVGAQSEEWRTTININLYDSKRHNVERAFLSLDYFFMNEVNTKPLLFSPYIGVNVGYMNFESIGTDENGLIYGGEAGLTLSLVESLDIDLGYRYSLSSPDALDHVGEFFLGLNFKY